MTHTPTHGAAATDRIPNLEALKAQLGFGDGANALLGLEPTAPVFAGTRPTKVSQRNPEGFGFTSRPGPEAPVTKTVGALLGEFFNFDQDRLKQVQHDLYLGGFYGRNAQPEDIAWGVAGDESTYNAWQNAVVRASRFHAVGKNITVDDVMDMAVQAGGGPAGSGQSRGATYAQLSDPVSLSQQLDDLGTKVIGRKATAEEKRLFTAFIHNRQRNVAQSVAGGANAAEGSVVDVTGVSPEAQAEEFLRRRNPADAGAVDFVNTAEGFVDSVMSHVTSRLGA